jgi:putative endonuclease
VTRGHHSLFWWTIPAFAKHPFSCPCEESSTHGAERWATKQSSAYNVLVSKQYYVYIMTNVRNAVLYVGVTNDLVRRTYEHKEKLVDGFTKKYNIVKLVYYEVFDDIENAILREKQIKAGSRQKKVQLVKSMNKEWRDLYDEL